LVFNSSGGERYAQPTLFVVSIDLYLQVRILPNRHKLESIFIDIDAVLFLDYNHDRYSE
tara:strand:+ start:256 stop:432 length:177 start_codon:yes stop_codon:yes gene_type:complete